MRDKFRDYFLRNFGFSNSEIRGIYLLIPFIIVSVTAPSIFHSYLSDDGEDVSQSEQKLLKQWLAESKLKLGDEIKSHAEVPKRLISEPFDPNTISIEQWVKRGFSEKVSQRINKYLEKGGRFLKKEDLLKIYGINEELAKSYFRDIHIKPSPKKSISKPKPAISKKSLKKIKEKKAFVKPDLNSADTTDFKQIRGIGPYFARKLVEHRNKLGGYVHVDQLREIYGVDTAVHRLILENTTFIPSTPTQININTADFDLLFKHPYLDYRTTVAILKYKKQHGPYQRVEDLKKILVLKDSTFLKVRPYLKIKD